MATTIPGAGRNYVSESIEIFSLAYTREKALEVCQEALRAHGFNVVRAGERQIFGMGVPEHKTVGQFAQIHLIESDPMDKMTEITVTTGRVLNEQTCGEASVHSQSAPAWNSILLDGNDQERISHSRQHGIYSSREKKNAIATPNEIPLPSSGARRSVTRENESSGQFNRWLRPKLDATLTVSCRLAIAETVCNAAMRSLCEQVFYDDETAILTGSTSGACGQDIVTLQISLTGYSESTKITMETRSENYNAAKQFLAKLQHRVSCLTSPLNAIKHYNKSGRDYCETYSPPHRSILSRA